MGIFSIRARRVENVPEGLNIPCGSGRPRDRPAEAESSSGGKMFLL